jgi:hypothetical protein
MDDEIFDLIIFFIVMTMLISLALFVVDVVRDASSIDDCQILGYDNGTYRFWKRQVMCWSVISPAQLEKREYFFPDK